MMIIMKLKIECVTYTTYIYIPCVLCLELASYCMSPWYSVFISSYHII
jgi:hypothetical protein